MPKYLDETGLATNIQIAKDTFMEKMTVDSTPTANSSNLVTSGGVKAAIPQILSGTTDPSSSLGNNGDLYIKISS